jgi:hypothetical protein
MKKILKITEIELIILKKNPPALSIICKGQVDSGGWSNGKLVPYFYIYPPVNGIYEFDFIADEPSGPVTTVISDITTEEYLWDNFPSDLKGVKIYASSNSKTKKLATMHENIGEWSAIITNEGKTPQINVFGSFPTRGQKPGYKLIKKSDENRELHLTLVFGRLVDRQGSVYFHESYSQALGSTDQFDSVSIYDDYENPGLLAKINIDQNEISFLNNEELTFIPYLETIKGIQIYNDFLKIRVPSKGLTDKSSFYIEIIRGITGLPPYIFKIHRIKPDWGKMFIPEGIELDFSFEELDLEPFSTFTLINFIG